MLLLSGLKLKDLSEYNNQTSNTIKHLDVSGNLLKSGKEFNYFPNLETLIIDNNYFFSLQDFPQLPNLITLSANKNTYNDITNFIINAKEKFPKLTHLSLIKNPICPLFTSGEKEYQEYCSIFMKEITTLKNLDGNMLITQVIEQNNIGQLNKNKLQQHQGTIEFNKKYQKPKVKQLKTKSEGNRFVRNDHL